MLPPFRRFYIFYCAFILILVGLVGMGLYLSRIASTPPNAWVLLSGVVIAVCAIAANALSQWRTTAVSNAMSLVSSMRLDPVYLKHAYVVRGEVNTRYESLSEEAKAKFYDQHAASSLEEPSFRSASLFLLNQYEFLAAGIRMGTVDEALIRQTMRTAIIDICLTYREVIAEIRAAPERRSNFENLIWLYRRFAETERRYASFGPI